MSDGKYIHFSVPFLWIRSCRCMHCTFVFTKLSNAGLFPDRRYRSGPLTGIPTISQIADAVITFYWHPSSYLWSQGNFNITKRRVWTCRVYSCLVMSNQRFLKIVCFRFPTNVPKKNRKYSFLKQNSLSNQNVLFQIQIFLDYIVMFCFC